MIEIDGYTKSTHNSCKEVEKAEKDMVNHPSYYNRKNSLECIDEMILVFGEEATANFCLLNCWKYRYRAGLKDNGYQDLEKSDWYMQKYKELKEKIANKKPTSYVSLTGTTQPFGNTINCKGI